MTHNEILELLGQIDEPEYEYEIDPEKGLTSEPDEPEKDPYWLPSPIVITLGFVALALILKSVGWKGLLD